MSRSRIGDVGVIDLFAGPGGLGEGFSSFSHDSRGDKRPYRMLVSAEMSNAAHATLQLRAFVRLLKDREGPLPALYGRYLQGYAAGRSPPPSSFFEEHGLSSLWRQAADEALNLTLGEPAHDEVLKTRIDQECRRYERLVLIGGPPCQAYSVVGRARQRHVKDFKTRGDHRHFLYRQYLGILAKFSPHVFIMENVKGLLTSSVGGASMFEAIQADLANPTATFNNSSARSPAAKRYVLLPIHVMPGELRTPDLVLADPSRYVLQCEQHGVPQARHRVIVMGVREDIFSARVHRVPGLEMSPAPATALDALSGLPAIRSAISRQPDCRSAWYDAMQRAGQYVRSVAQRSYPEVADFLQGYAPKQNLDRAAKRYRGQSLGLSAHLRVEGLDLVLNHESRSHMEGDLRRYLFAAAFNQVYASSPLSADFPSRLAPNHTNWTGGTFADRFRVQSSSKPASTVTSHLSKDGHAFIHWDHRQCRSISVREAARLQTFPDDYLFLGSRTEQFVQVGNAVPPHAARQIARVVWNVLNA